MMERENGTLNYIMGRTGSAKTHYAMRRIGHAKRERILAWDPDCQFCLLPGFQRVETIGELMGVLKSTPGPGKFAYQVKSLKEFDAFCKMAFTWNMMEPCTIIAEEIADVVCPGKAADGWGILIRRGRKYGAEVYALTQRPAETDKTILGNCSTMVFFAPNTELDRNYIIKNIGLDPALIPTEDTFFTLRSKTGEISQGQVTF